MHSFEITFTKYKDCERYNSAPVHRTAEDFRDCFEYATAALFGMRQADPDAEFDISSIVTTGYSGIFVKHGFKGIFTPDMDEAEA